MQRVLLTTMWLALSSSVAQAQGGAAASATTPEALAPATLAPGSTEAQASQPEPERPQDLAAPDESSPRGSDVPAHDAPVAPASPSAAAPEPEPVPPGYVRVPAMSPAAQAPQYDRPKPSASSPRRYGDAGAPFAIAVGGGFVWNDDPGYALVGSTRQRQLEVFASYDILQVTKRLVVSVGASLRRHRAEEDLLDVSDHTLQAELLARFALKSWLWPHARVSAGAVWTRLSLDGAGQAGAIDERDVAFASSFGGGLTLRTPTRTFETRQGRFASLSLGLLVEGGYTLAEEARFVGRPDGSTSDVSRSAVALGGLDRAAPYLRIMGVVRF